MARITKKRLITILVTLSLLAAGCLILFIYHCINVSLEAEITYGANWTILVVLETYMIENPGRWPASWDELERTSIPAEQQRMFYWPDDIDKFKKRVHVEFGLSLQEVADMVTPEQVKRGDFDNFTAVRPIGPNYGPCESNLGHFMEVVWRENSKAKQRNALQKER